MILKRLLLCFSVVSTCIAQQLQPLVFTPLRTGDVLPRGWLSDELQVQASGLSGNLYKWWTPVSESQWTGGSNTFEDWFEILPYYIDGISPLAFLLQDENLTAVVANTLDYIFTHPHSDGSFGPQLGNGDGMEYWIGWPVMKAALTYAEATGNMTYVPLILQWLHASYDRMTTGNDPFGYSWQSVRWADWVWITEYLIDHIYVPVPDSEMTFLYNLSTLVYRQSLNAGVDYENKWYTDAYFPKQAVPGNQCNLTNHGVNTGMAVKSGAVLYRLTGEPLGVNSTYKRMQLLDTYHGVPSGVFQADEHLAGNVPNHGTETCTVAELMFSHNVIHEALGDPYFAERAEQIAYNAMPASMTKDMWARVYLQFMNDYQAVPENNWVWISDGPDSSIFSLEGNYACCTSNFHQAWPKLVTKMIHATADGGAAVSILGPVSAVLPSGAAVIVDTEYPFGDDLNITVFGIPTTGMPFYVRIPSWATNASMAINGDPAVNVGAFNGTMYLLDLTGSSASIQFFTNPSIRVTSWPNNAIAVHRGALLYSLQFNESFTVIATNPGLSRDYNVTIAPGSVIPWNLALVLDPSQPDQGLVFSRNGPVPSVPFTSQDPPVSITATARQVPSWGTQSNAPGLAPLSPVDCSSISGGCGNPISVVLVPYGSTHIRMSEMPYILP